MIFKRCLFLATTPMTLMKFLLLFLLFGLMGCSGSAPAPLTERQKREEDLRELEGVIRRCYAYVDEKRADADVDLDGLFATARGRLDGVASDTDFLNILREVIAGLKDGHCEIEAEPSTAPAMRTWPVLLNTVKEGIVVTGTHPDLPPTEGVARGDLIQSVNGRAIEDRIHEATRTISSSSDHARQRMALRRMIATPDDSVIFGVEHPDGTRGTVRVKTVAGINEPIQQAFALGRYLDDGIGLIRIPSFSPPDPAFWKATTDAERDSTLQSARKEIDAAFTALNKSQGIILDLRGNPGGNDVLGAYLISHLVSGDFLYYTTQTRSSAELRRQPGFSHLPEKDGWATRSEWRPRKSIYTMYTGPIYSGRFTVLINESCFSVTDCVLHAMADLRPGVRFVGRQAGGGAGGPTHVATLAHCKAKIRLCVMKVWSPNGTLIEGHGIKPHVPVQWTQTDVLKNQNPDPDVAAALADMKR